jgi:Holliday junction resolvase
MTGRRSREKGQRTERNVAAELNRHGIPATKRSGMYIAGHDLVIVVRGRPLRVEVKSRAQVLAQSTTGLAIATC